MFGTRIFVVHLKTIIKYGIAALAAIIAAAVLFAVLSGSGGKSVYSPGTYSAEIVLHSNPVSIQVTVDKHNIKSVEMLDMGETESVFYPVFEQSFDDIARQIVYLQSTQDVQLSEDNAVTGGIILDAVNAALKMAEK